MISAACKKRVWKTVCLNGIFLLLCLLALMPILYALSVSFSGRGTVLSGSLSLFPQNPTFENYRAILFDEPFLLWMKNSLLLSAGTILLAMLCAIPAAYAASRCSRLCWSSTLFLRSFLCLHFFACSRPSVF